MTENEALKLMESLVIDPKCELVKTLDFKATVIKALEEIQQHREKVQAFEAIGTIEEFKALKEKNEPKKPILNNPKIDEFYVKEAKLCPSCHSYINNYSGDYCRDCGQRIDWSE